MEETDSKRYEGNRNKDKRDDAVNIYIIYSFYTYKTNPYLYNISIKTCTRKED